MPFRISRRQCLGGLAAILPVAANAQAVPAQGAAGRDAPRLKRGINIHNALNWPQATRAREKTYYSWPAFRAANFQVSDAELKTLSALGFDFIRLTVDPGIFIDVAADRFAALDAHALALVKRFIGAGFSVVFDLHPVALNPDYAPRRLVAEGSPVFAAYCDLVERLAGVLNELPHDKIAFELMNEPWIETLPELPRWQPMLETLHQRARKAAPNLPLVLTGAMWGDLQAMVRLDTKPFRASNVIYTFHYYDPHSFTHQGVAGDDAQYLAAVPWPMTARASTPLVDAASDRIAATAGLTNEARTQAIARSRQLVDNLLRKNHGPALLKKDFALAAAWAKTNGIGTDRLLLGEFGCVANARDMPLGEDRLRWIEAVRQAAEAEGIAWAYWAYKGYGGMEMADRAGKLDTTVLPPLGLRTPA
ncbi:glycoside hydrolase family 5 protein [Bosea lathyri]|uniref:Cellulase (Glycosyl hydrolase family 5) n=1 Tax=Bosea lathyri TaxID=1036778 RepID=A0A1H6BHC9_9HYPH|nr:cellulase family glycosylhydrolase [Bosea lathyri]SEG60151.1 Cellulase (glycosyl hydrolase family 5) [Bosea lathyri]